MAEVAYLVRHGDYETDYNGTRLTDLGVEQSEAARDELLARQLGGRAYLLSSSAGRALKTAEIIGQGLELDVLASQRIQKGSLDPDAVNVLGEFLRQSAEIDLGMTPEPEVPFIVVCHAPLIAALERIPEADSVQKGVVYEVSESAANPDYKEYMAGFILDR